MRISGIVRVSAASKSSFLSSIRNPGRLPHCMEKEQVSNVGEKSCANQIVIIRVQSTGDNDFGSLQRHMPIITCNNEITHSDICALQSKLPTLSNHLSLKMQSIFEIALKRSGVDVLALYGNVQFLLVLQSVLGQGHARFLPPGSSTVQNFCRLQQ